MNKGITATTLQNFKRQLKNESLFFYSHIKIKVWIFTQSLMQHVHVYQISGQAVTALGDKYQLRKVTHLPLFFYFPY